MANIFSVSVIAAVAVAIFLLVHFLRGRQPLIHGPPRDSLIAGNLAQLFSAGGMKYHEKFTKEYGNAFEVYGLFGVNIRFETSLISR